MKSNILGKNVNYIDDVKPEKTHYIISSDQLSVERDDPFDPPPSPAAPGARTVTKKKQLAAAVASTLSLHENTNNGRAVSDVKAGATITQLVSSNKKNVVIIGGGPAGFSAVQELVERAESTGLNFRVVILDNIEQESLGRGAPFRKAPGVARNVLLMNMVSHSIGKAGVIHSLLLKSLNGIFAEFPRRSDVGDCLRRSAEKILARAEDAGLQVSLVKGRAYRIDRHENSTLGIGVHMADRPDCCIKADAVLLAIGNEQARRYSHLAGQRYIDNPFSETHGIYKIPKNATVAVAGTSLTAMDVASVLEARGHLGSIHLFSRQGRLPGGRPLHKPVKLLTLSPERIGETLSRESLPLGIDAVVRLVRREFHEHGLSLRPIQKRILFYLLRSPSDFLMEELKHAGRVNATWALQKAIDDCVAQIWHLMSVEARRFFLDHWMSTFSAIQWSSSSPTASRIAAMLNSRILTVHSGNSARRLPDGRFLVSCRDRELVTEYFVEAAGFAQALSEFNDPLIRSMADSGLLTPDKCGRGAKVRFEDGCLLDNQDQPVGPIFATASALTQGTFFASNELGAAMDSAARSASAILDYLAVKDTTNGQAAGG